MTALVKVGLLGVTQEDQADIRTGMVAREISGRSVFGLPQPVSPASRLGIVLEDVWWAHSRGRDWVASRCL